jgi:FtsP/CotA-like multicopper oxidase with cupredoxin domain
VVQPAVTLDASERVLFRLLNATAARVLDLAIDNERIGLVAVDGYPVGSAPGGRPVLWSGDVVVPPGGRAEFIATGLSRPTVLRTRCYDSGPAGDRDPQDILAVLRPAMLDGAPAASGEPKAARSGDISIPLGPVARRRRIVLGEDADGFYINGKAFSMGAAPAIVARAGTLEEWSIFNDTDEVHALHLHQVHFLVESVDGVRANPPIWRDTLLVPIRSRRGGRIVPGTAKILVDFRDPVTRGTFVFHCHMADHEDGGMMAILKVI